MGLRDGSGLIDEMTVNEVGGGGGVSGGLKKTKLKKKYITYYLRSLVVKKIFRYFS